MRGMAATLAMALALALGASAQEPPTPPPDRASASAHRPPQRPADAQATEDGKGSAPALDSGARPDPGSGAASAPVPASAPVDPSATAAGDPPPPPGPPLPETLRESDFDNAACRLALFSLGAEYREIPPLADENQRDCGIARPVEVTQILPGIALEGGPRMRCDTARALARWMREIVVPAASHLSGAPRITALTPGSTYQCRAVVGNGDSHTISEHALGNAIDIAAFTFDNGTRIEIAPPQDRGDLSVAFQNAVQGAACLFFTTVLGPGSNAAHDNHLHLDIKQRRGGLRLCQ